MQKWNEPRLPRTIRRVPSLEQIIWNEIVEPILGALIVVGAILLCMWMVR